MSRARFWSTAIVGTRLAALLAVIYLSLHYWKRAGYWEFGGIRQYGLPLLDPRIPAALICGAFSAAFWICVVLPIALWLAEHYPSDAPGRRFATAVLALGLGTRGVVGPLLVRAAVGAPLVLLPAGATVLESPLVHPYTARWLVLLTQVWWVLPLLIAALRLLGAQSVPRARVLWAVRGLLAAYAVCQPIDVPYLLTAGGPHGATQTLTLVAFQEGFGRQEFGYASVLAVLLCFAVLPVARLLRAGLTEMTPDPTPADPLHAVTGRMGWTVLGFLFLLPFVTAMLRLPAPLAVPPAAWSAALVSLFLALVGGAWSAFLSGALIAPARRDSGRQASLVEWWALLFPPLVLILPMIRPWGYRTGPVEAGVLFLGMAVFAPHLGLAVITGKLHLLRGSAPHLARHAAGWAVAWAIWTELGLDLMLSQSRHAGLPLQGWMAWELSTVMRASPLAVPGWPLAWAGGTLLAWFALSRLFQTSSDLSTLSDPQRVP